MAYARTFVLMQAKLLRLAIKAISLSASLLIASAYPAQAMPDDVLLERSGGDAVDPTVDESSGSASIRIPIEIPPGPGGLAPSLAFTYSSAQSGGPLGVGWNIPLGEISCSGRFGVRSTPGCNRYELDGQLLVGPTVANGSIFHTAVESFSRIIHRADDSWEVTTPEGRVSVYGKTASSRIIAGGATVRWLLSEVRDPFDQAVISFEYAAHGDKGTLYPERITYGPAGTREITFLYETRPDSVYEFSNGVEQARTQRLSEVRVAVNQQAHSRLALAYESDPSRETTLSRLKSITRYGKDCSLTAALSSCNGLPPQEFRYRSASGQLIWQSYAQGLPDWKIPFQIIVVHGWSDRGIHDTQIADVNGDGLPDLIHDPVSMVWGNQHVSLSPNQRPSIYLNTGIGWETPSWSSSNETGPYNESARWTEKLRQLSVQLPRLQATTAGIANGVYSVATSTTAQGVEFGFQPTERRPGYDITQSQTQNSDIYTVQMLGSFQVIDVDADGLADLVYSARLSGMTIWKNADGSEKQGPWAVSPGQTAKIVLRNTGSWDPQNASSSPWVQDENLAQGLPLFGLLNVEDADFVGAKMGANSIIPGTGGVADPENTGPCFQWGLGGARWGSNVYARSNWGGTPPAFDEWICRAPFDLRPVFQDFNGDGFVDVAVLEPANPDALFLGPGVIITDGTSNYPLGTYRVSEVTTSVYVQNPEAAPGQPRWQKRNDLSLPFTHIDLNQKAGDAGHWTTLINTDAPGTPGINLYDPGVRFVDLNRDGLTDVIWYDWTASFPVGRESGPTAVSGVLINTGRPTGSGAQSGYSWCASRPIQVKPAPAPSTAGGSIVPVCSEAQRFELPAVVGATFTENTQSNVGRSNELFFGDVNGDGWQDLIQTMDLYLSAENHGPRTWIHNPSSTNVWSLSSQFKPPTVSNFLNGGAQPHGRLIFDANGDGVTDFLSDKTCTFYCGTEPYSFEYRYTSYLSRVSFPDLVFEHKNGRGGTITIDYSSSIGQRDGSASTSLEGEALTHAAQATIQETVDPTKEAVLWRPRPVVSQVTMKGATPAPAAVTKYRYAHPRWSREHRTDLGYRVVRRTLPNNSAIKTFYYQNIGRSGRVSERIHFASESSSAPPLNYTREVWELPDPFSVLGSWGGSGTSNPGARVGRLAWRLTRNEYGATVGAQVGAERATVFGYDGPSAGYNFVTSVVETRPSGVLKVVRTRTEDPTYFLVRLLETQEKYDFSGNYASPRLLERTTFQYVNSTGASTRNRVGKRGDWVAWRNSGAGAPPPSGKTIWTSFSYDGYGNLIEVQSEGPTDADDVRRTQICYDGDNDSHCPHGQGSHSIVVGVKDALGRWRASIPDEVLPAITATSSEYIDEPKFDMELDAFGRVVREWVYATPSTRLVTTEIGYVDSPTLPSVSIKNHADASGANFKWRGIVEDGFGGVWKDLYAVDGGRYAGTATWVDAGQSLVRRTLPIACAAGGNPAVPWSICANLTGANDAANSPAESQSTDAIGRMVQSTRPDGFSRVRYSGTTYAGKPTDVVLEKNPKGDLTQRIVDGDRNMALDECKNAPNPSLSDLTGIACQNADRTEYIYDPTGELTVIYDPIAVSTVSYGNFSHSTIRIYDTLGRVVSTHDPNAGQTTATYDDAGNLRDSIDHGRSLTRSHRYDSLNRITQIIPPSGEETVNFTYMPSLTEHTMQPVFVLTPSVEKKFYYNALGQTKQIDRTIQGTFLTTSYEYDLLGRVIQTKYPIKVNGVRTVVQHEYAGGYLKRVCDIAIVPSPCATSANPYVTDALYDPTGNVSKIALPGGPREFQYDPATQRKTLDRFDAKPWDPNQQDLNDYFVEFSYKSSSNVPYYDPLGNILQVEGRSWEPSGAPVAFGGTYSYDHRNRLATWQRTGQSQKAYSYDPLGNLTGLEGQTQQYSLTKPHQVTSVTGANGTLPYNYDASGNVTSLLRYGGGPTSHFKYDSANRLICSSNSSPNNCENLSVLYAGDGERVRHQDITGYGYFHAGPDFKYMMKPTAQLKQSWIEIYGFGERIATKQIDMGTLVTASEDWWWLPRIPEPLIPISVMLLSVVVFGRLSSLQVVRQRPAAATLAVIISSQLAVPRVASAGGGGGGGGAVPEQAICRWVISDQVGSGLVLIDNVGNRISHTVYSPFGTVVQQKGILNGKSIYAGHEVETTTGLVYMNARWYDPASGRFMSVDPVIDMRSPQSAYAYSYVSNNPVNASDPSGAMGCQGYVGSCEFIGVYGVDSKGNRYFGDAIQQKQNQITNQNIAAFAKNLGSFQTEKLQSAVESMAESLVVFVAGASSSRLAQGGYQTATWSEATSTMTTTWHAALAAAPFPIPLPQNPWILAGLAILMAAGILSTPREDTSVDVLRRRVDDGPYLVRYGTDTVDKLASDAAKAEAHKYGHSVSVMRYDKLSRSQLSRMRAAPLSEARMHYSVSQTGKDPRHYSVEIEKPVTEQTLEKFNSVFRPR